MSSKDFTGSLAAEDQEPLKVGKYTQVIDPATGRRIVPVTKEELIARSKSRPTWRDQAIVDACPWCGRAPCECRR